MSYTLNGKALGEAFTALPVGLQEGGSRRCVRVCVCVFLPADVCTSSSFLLDSSLTNEIPQYIITSVIMFGYTAVSMDVPLCQCHPCVFHQHMQSQSYAKAIINTVLFHIRLIRTAAGTTRQ